MYVSPSVLATFDEQDLFGEAYGGNPFCGDEGNDKGVGNGSCHSPV